MHCIVHGFALTILFLGCILRIELTVSDFFGNIQYLGEFPFKTFFQFEFSISDLFRMAFVPKIHFALECSDLGYCPKGSVPVG